MVSVSLDDDIYIRLPEKMKQIAKHDKKIIITSIVTTAYFAERIAGEKAEVNFSYPSGGQPPLL